MSEIPLIYVVAGPGIERRKSIADQLDGLGVEYVLVEAIFPSEQEFSIWKGKDGCGPDFGVEIQKKGQLGCILSHQLIYRCIVESGHRLAVVLEDDAELSPVFKGALSALGEADFDVCLLGVCGGLSRKSFRYWGLYNPLVTFRQYGRFRIGRPLKPYWGTVGYAITLSAAQRMLEVNSGPKTVADNWPFFSRSMRVEEMRPLVVYENWERFNVSSTDGADRSVGVKDDQGGMWRHWDRVMRGWRRVWMVRLRLFLARTLRGAR